MRRPDDFQLDQAKLPSELATFRALLGGPTEELSERDQVLPFFKEHKNVAALVGMEYHPALGVPTVLKAELELFGDWACDLAIGHREHGEFCFVEFENAAADSVFKRNPKKGLPDWSPRLEHGLSQINDWFYHLSNNAHTPQFRSFFTTDLAHYSGLLVIGRDAFLTDDQQHRLRWRSQNTLVAGKPVSIVAFDKLYRLLSTRAELFATPGLGATPEEPSAP